MKPTPRPIVMINSPGEELTLRQIKNLTLPELESQIRADQEQIRSTGRNILKYLYVIYERAEELLDTKKVEFLDKRSGKFAFSKYIQFAFNYGAVTSSTYAGILRMIQSHQMPEALEYCNDIKVLELIKVCDPVIQKRLLLDVENLTRDSFKERRAELEGRKKVGKRKSPQLKRIPGFPNLHKKLDLDNQSLIIKGKDKAYLAKLDQLLDTFNPGEVDRLLKEREVKK